MILVGTPGYYLKVKRNIPVHYSDLSGTPADVRLTVRRGADVCTVDLTTNEADQVLSPIEWVLAKGYRRTIVPDPKDVREWALARGIPLRSRGRLPRDIVDAYLSSKGRV